MLASERIAVIGLGYVGLGLAIALSRHYSVHGIDIDETRLEELRRGHDRTGEVEDSELGASSLTFASSPEKNTGFTTFIVTVPTPVDTDNNPDLSLVEAACDMVGSAMEPGAVVVFESTVYPGVTEEVCGPRLEAASGLVCGRDFFLGYSPERVNPGDREHSIDRIVKVVAGQTEEVTERLAEIYSTVASAGGIFKARNIKTAEAAKIIENAQRDINIAFMNEVSQIFRGLGIDTYDVLEAANTKWNFLPFKPGLVGGHCIGVDPYYLAYCAKKIGHNPGVILAGRAINDEMGGHFGKCIHAALPSGNSPSRILVLGLTFKENVPDLRNSKVAHLIDALRSYGHTVDVHDPLADSDEARTMYGITLLTGLDGLEKYDCLIGAVSHDSYQTFTTETFENLVIADGLVADIKGMWRDITLPSDLRRWHV